MQVKLRLQRFGRKSLPFYRIVAATSRSPRDGKFLEILGLYHPTKPQEQQVRVDLDKVRKWLDNGAQPTEMVESILSRMKFWQTYRLEKEVKRLAKQKKRYLNKKQVSSAV